MFSLKKPLPVFVAAQEHVWAARQAVDAILGLAKMLWETYTSGVDVIVVLAGMLTRNAMRGGTADFKAP